MRPRVRAAVAYDNGCKDLCVLKALYAVAGTGRQGRQVNAVQGRSVVINSALHLEPAHSLSEGDRQGRVQSFQEGHLTWHALV